jgi:hypothetical protein
LTMACRASHRKQVRAGCEQDASARARRTVAPHGPLPPTSCPNDLAYRRGAVARALLRLPI